MKLTVKELKKIINENLESYHYDELEDEGVNLEFLDPGLYVFHNFHELHSIEEIKEAAAARKKVYWIAPYGFEDMPMAATGLKIWNYLDVTEVSQLPAQVMVPQGTLVIALAND
jgi:phage-related protein